MNELALFAGAGGGLLGTKLLGWTPVCAVEKVPYRREVLLRRQRDGVLPVFPIWDDVRTFDGRPWRGLVDVVTAGFPCQPFSGAGKQQGKDDERNMWPETIRIIHEVRPQFCFLENVPALLTFRYCSRIFGDLVGSGYDCRWCVLSAGALGAPHLRKRLWVMARNTDNSIGAEKQIISERRKNTKHSGVFEWWKTEPDVGRVDNGMAHRLDRLAAIGDGQVPAVVAKAWMLLNK